jgi:ribose-phosphate pyrophosphokinase
MTIHFQAKHPTGFTINSPLQPLVFPDGAVHITGADDETEYDYQIADVRGMSHDDLFTLAMWGNACDNRGEDKVIILPYLPGARMDRGNPEGAHVYAWFILNDIAPTQLITIDPHSERATTFYQNYQHNGRGKFTVFPVERIIRKEIQDPTQDTRPDTYVGVIAPDHGAVARATAAAEAMGVPVYRAEKKRDFATGKLSGFGMVDELPEQGKLLIVDDLCDGGGTFLGLAEATGLQKERLDLWVTHGIFSKGLDPLVGHFGTVHTTDSYYTGGDHNLRERGDSDLFRLKVHKLTPYLYPEINIKDKK